MRAAETIDLARAKEVLDEDHFDLEEIKERILEHLAVLKLIENGIVLDISLVAFLCLGSARKRSIWILQPLSNIHTFPSSKNFLTTPLSKPLIPCSFVFSRLIISRLFSNRGG